MKAIRIMSMFQYFIQLQTILAHNCCQFRIYNIPAILSNCIITLFVTTKYDYIFAGERIGR